MNDLSPLSSSHCRMIRSPWSTGDVPYAHAHGRDAAQLRLPEQLAVEVVRVQALRPEPRVHALAVHDRRGRGEAAAAVARVVGVALPRGLLPQHLPAVGVHRQHLQRLRAVGAHAVGMRRTPCPRRGASRAGEAGLADVALDRRGQEDAIAPHHRRRVAAAGDGRLPQHVLGRAPRERQAGLGRDALAVRAAELRPAVRLGSGSAEAAAPASSSAESTRVGRMESSGLDAEQVADLQEEAVALAAQRHGGAGRRDRAGGCRSRRRGRCPGTGWYENRKSRRRRLSS